MRNKKYAAIGATAVLTFSVGTAYAYWTTSGSGTGAATAGTTAAVTVSQTNAVTDLRPGGAAKAIDFKVSNPQNTNQYVTTVKLYVAGANNSVWSAQADTNKPACTAADFSITGTVTLAKDLVPGDNQFDSAGAGGTGATIALVNSSNNQDNCKNVTPPIWFVAE